jgi:hypothetical protein
MAGWDMVYNDGGRPEFEVEVSDWGTTETKNLSNGLK